MRLLVTVLVLAAVAGGPSADALENPDLVLSALMPRHPTETEDSYLCTSIHLPSDALQLVGFTPRAHDSVVHHMLLFGCTTPAQPDALVWDCKMKKVCGPQENENVLYGWGRNAPAVTLPPDTGFAVGGDSSVQMLVLQVHYLQPRPAEDTPAGLDLALSRRQSSRSAGMWAFARSFQIPPHTPRHPVPNTCCYAGFEPLTAIAARVHTHAMGRSVELDRRGAGDEWHDILEQDPHKPQGFYPLTQELEILPGETFRTTCVFDSSNKSEVVRAGHGSANEMCNLYLLTSGRLPVFQWCVDDRAFASASTPGALPPGAAAARESEVWRPPVDLGQAGGLASDGRGRVYSFARAGRVWDVGTFDPGSHTLREGGAISSPVLRTLREDDGAEDAPGWGAGAFRMPHGVTVAPDGSLWLTDVGRHQALQFSTAGDPLRALGTEGVPGDGTGAALCMPTDVAVARDGTTYVSDGYCAARVAVYGPGGEFRASYTLPPPHAMHVPHSLALEECSGLLYVASREAGRVHALDAATGELRGTWDTAPHGLPYALALGPYGAVHVLTWRRGEADGPALGDAAAFLLVLAPTPGQVAARVPLPGLDAPHDLALVPAPLQLTGTGERALAVVVAEASPEGARLVKFVFRAAQGGGDTGVPSLHADDVVPTVSVLEAVSHDDWEDGSADAAIAARVASAPPAPTPRRATGWMTLAHHSAPSTPLLLGFAAGVSASALVAMAWRSGCWAAIFRRPATRRYVSV